MHTIRRFRFLTLAAPLLSAAACSDVTAPLNDHSARPAFSITPGSGTWTTKAPLLLAQNTGATAVINQQLYVASAFDFAQMNLQVYDPATNAWTLKAPSIGRAYTAGVGIDGKFYLAGGCINADCGAATTNLVEAYDPATNAWTTKAPMPTARGMAGGAAIGGKWYVVGGRGSCGPCGYDQSFSGALEVYDPASDSWTSKAPMPVARSSVAAAAVGGKLYVVGTDFTGTSFVPHLDVYDPASDSWVARTPPASARWGGGVAEMAGIIYSVSGTAVPDAELGSTVVEAYDPASDRWTSVASIPVGGLSTRPQAINGVLYAVETGGNSGTLLQVFKPESALPPPASQDQCKNGGWARFTNPRSFKNQGDCIQFVNTGK